MDIITISTEYAVNVESEIVEPSYNSISLENECISFPPAMG